MENKRKSMGKTKNGVVIPVAPNLSEMSDDYMNLMNDIKESISQERLKIVLTANSSMILLYWNIGNKILKKQQAEGWGAKVIDRLSMDLKEAFPEMEGFSSRNLKYMRKFAESWPDVEIVQRTIAQIPWRSNIVLMDKLNDRESRLWYAGKFLECGWSKDILNIQISTNLIVRQGNAVSNFEIALPPKDSDLASHVF